QERHDGRDDVEQSVEVVAYPVDELRNPVADRQVEVLEHQRASSLPAAWSSSGLPSSLTASTWSMTVVGTGWAGRVISSVAPGPGPRAASSVTRGITPTRRPSASVTATASFDSTAGTNRSMRTSSTPTVVASFFTRPSIERSPLRTSLI